MGAHEDEDVLYRDVRSRCVDASIRDMLLIDSADQPEQALALYDLPPIPRDVEFRLVSFGDAALVAGRCIFTVFLRPAEGGEIAHYRVGKRFAEMIRESFYLYGFPLRVVKRGEGLEMTITAGPPPSVAV